MEEEKSKRGGGGATFLFDVIILVTFIFLGAYFIPWNRVDWGKLEFGQPRTITVLGYAETQEKSQIARFSAGVTFTSDNKEEAINFVNQKVEEIIAAVKNFGIEEADIKTQDISVYQQEEPYWEEGRQKTRPGQWRVENTIEIILRDVDLASDLTDLLTSTGATNVYGPSFSLDDTKASEESLLKEAIEDARKKAQIIADASGKKLGEIVNVSEGDISAPIGIMMRDASGGAAPVEPGSSTVAKSVTVTFEIE